MSSAARRPYESARLIMNITLGPGMMMMANANTAKATIEFGGGTGEACRFGPAGVQLVPGAAPEGATLGNADIELVRWEEYYVVDPTL